MDVRDALNRSVWDRFVKEGALDDSRINKRISESWLFCRQKGINPYYGKGKTILTKDKFQERKKANKKLLHTALPVLKNLLPFLNHTKAVFLLVDPEGYVLFMDGHEMALHKAKSIHFIEGVKWTEEEVGTNAIGTALRIKEPIQIVGAEHYAVASHSWGCCSSPIWNEDGQMAGILNTSYPVRFGIDEQMLPFVIAATYAIEQRLVADARTRELELLKHASLIQLSHSLTIICDNQGKLVWVTDSMRKLLPKWHQLTLSDVKGEGFSITWKKPLYSFQQKDSVIGYQIQLKKWISKLMSQIRSTFTYEGVQGKSETFQKTLLQAEKASRANIPIHLSGETGTGKELLARAIHINSPRTSGPFIPVNCGAIPKDLMAGELFGYVSGAFTGAKRSGHKGKFEQAHGGTLFLDEIGEISQEMQIALLRVLEEKKIVPLGGVKPVDVDIRIITASHRDLEEMVDKGSLREDLFYRIFVYPIELPPLRKRIEDIPCFIKDYCQKNDWHIHFPKEVVAYLQSFPWPGNIRQLLHCLGRLHVEAGSSQPTLELISSMLSPKKTLPPSLDNSLQDKLTFREQMERSKIAEALIAANGNVAKAAAQINMPRSTFYRKLKKLNL